MAASCAPSLSGNGFFSLVSVCFKLFWSNAVMPSKMDFWVFSVATSIYEKESNRQRERGGRGKSIIIEQHWTILYVTHPQRWAKWSSLEWRHSSVSPYWNPPIGSSDSRPPWADPWVLVLVLLGLPSATNRAREREIKIKFESKQK